MEEFMVNDSFGFGEVPNNEETNFGFGVNNNDFQNFNEFEATNNGIDPFETEQKDAVVNNESIEESAVVIDENNKIEEKENFDLEIHEVNNYDNEENQNVFDIPSNINFENEELSFSNDEVVEDTPVVVESQKVDDSFLGDIEYFGGLDTDNIEYDVVKPSIEPQVDIEVPKKQVNQNIVSDTPIEELNKLTEYEEEKIDPTNIRALFSKVGGNVKEASEIFIKNAEMKDKIDARFRELKQLQLQLEETKKAQYDEINAYKEEVFGKLTEKKEEIENRISKLKEFQEKIEKEKEEFEKYKKSEKEQIEQIQKEVQDAYDSRREELNHIEDVLRKQKDVLDEERSQLSLDRIQYESDKNELANNLLKFNEIVDSFTSGVDRLGNEE